MLKNYFKIAIRNVLRFKLYSFINIVGLSVGIAACVLIMLWVQDEVNFDRFHKKVENIFRVMNYQGDFENRGAGTPAPLGPAMKEEIPDVVNYVRFASAPRKVVVKYGKNIFYENRIVFADPSVFEVFTFPFVEGDPNTVLSGLSNVVISENIAHKYFGEEEPVGKTLTIEGTENVVVSGVIKNIPSQSHIQFDFLVSFENIYASHMYGTRWGDFNFNTYVQLRPNAYNADYNRKLTDIAASHNCPQVVYGKLKFGLQPMNDVHLDPGVAPAGTEITAEPGDKDSVLIFSLIALFSLGIACINFMNISTARSETRRKEVAVRKALGAYRYQLIGQFVGESIIMTLGASIIALGWVELVLPSFNSLTGKNLALKLLDMKSILDLTAITILTAIAAAIYPALYLSSFRPIDRLKQRMSGFQLTFKGMVKRSGASFLRTFLVVAQFSLSIGLIICTLVALKQLKFMRDKNLGFNKDNVVVVPVRENFGTKYAMIKDQLLQNSSIVGVTAEEWLQIQGPRNTGGYGYNWEGNPDPSRSPMISHTMVDYDFIKTMNIKMVDGRDFSKDHPSDAKEAFIVNQEAVKMIGLKSPVGKYFRLYGQEGKIIGVMQDAYFSSLHRKVEPLVYHILTDVNNARAFGAILVRVKGSQISEGISAVEKVWKAQNPNSPFEFQLLDEAINSRYISDQRTQKIFGAFASIAIVISCLGLFGLAAFTAQHRQKEIAIRKTLGAPASKILASLTGDFAKWVIIANAISWPVAYYFMNNWLKNFAYRTDIHLWIFVASGAMALVIALLTVGSHAIKAATANPVDSLRYE
jgi:ABC-type antimicrobial peptide transport system permease subunit